MTQKILTITDHSRDAAGLKYVYPVVSRRAGGVSVGINLNPNRQCNWACVYCQVPGLTRGRAPVIDMTRLEAELRGFLRELITGDYFIRHVPEGSRRLADIAISGDGEPTSAREFGQVVALLARLKSEGVVDEALPLRLITNGSTMGQAAVQRAIKGFGEIGGEVWFKVDGGNQAAIRAINQVSVKPASIAHRLAFCAEHAATWVQTCMFAMDGAAPDDNDIDDYCALLQTAGVEALQGVLLYGLARPSQQPQAPRLAALAPATLQDIANRIHQKTGLTVRVSP